MDEFSNASYRETIRALDVRLGGNREEFASLWISLHLYSEMSFATKFMGVRVSVIEMNYNVHPPPKKKTVSFTLHTSNGK